MLFEAYESNSKEDEIFIFHAEDSDERFIYEVEGILLTTFAPPNKELSSMQQCK